jgi:hypothetical protein
MRLEEAAAWFCGATELLLSMKSFLHGEGRYSLSAPLSFWERKCATVLLTRSGDSRPLECAVDAEDASSAASMPAAAAATTSEMSSAWLFPADCGEDMMTEAAAALAAAKSANGLLWYWRGVVALSQREGSGEEVVGEEVVGEDLPTSSFWLSDRECCFQSWTLDSFIPLPRASAVGLMVMPLSFMLLVCSSRQLSSVASLLLLVSRPPAIIPAIISS